MCPPTHAPSNSFTSPPLEAKELVSRAETLLKIRCTDNEGRRIYLHPNVSMATHP
jgi:hypothetical protein